MLEKYVAPEVSTICFASAKAIALNPPGWGWEDGVFDESAPEPKGYQDDAEGGAGYEG